MRQHGFKPCTVLGIMLDEGKINYFLRTYKISQARNLLMYPENALMTT